MAKPQSVPEANLPYLPLPTGVDAIRILTIRPAKRFQDPLVGELNPVTFESKPNYVALSYTWCDPYPDNARLPTSPPATEFPYASPRLASILPKGLSGTSPSIQRSSNPAALSLNDQPYSLSHNLHLALRHLRSSEASLTLWVDAICINQADMKERNAQVALMSFIFMRAVKVVSWLGTKDYGNRLDPFECMSIDWKAGQAQHFAASLAGGTRIQCSFPPNGNALARIAESLYWTRIWVVQELCLPRLLVFVYGANIWTYEDFRECSMPKAARSQPPDPDSVPHRVMNGRFQPMLQLFDTRDTKHKDSMRLENLMKRFATSGCAELRDRVYGLLGLANNIYPVTGVNNAANLVEKHIGPLGSQLNSLLEPKNGPGFIPVDYSRSLYDIWADVVISVCVRAKGMEDQTRNEPKSAFSGLNDLKSISLTDRGHAGAVRTASIVQEALNQMVEKDVINLESSEASPEFSLVPQN